MGPYVVEGFGEDGGQKTGLVRWNLRCLLDVAGLRVLVQSETALRSALAMFMAISRTG